MEKFRLDIPFDKQDFIRVQLIKWKFQWMKNRRRLIIYSVVSLIVLTIGILSKTEEEPPNLFFFLGIGSTVSTLYLIYLRIFSKQRYTRKIKEIAERFDSLKMDCTYEFSDESIKYWDKEKNLEFKWSVFTNYSIYKEYLILTINNSLIEAYIFEKKESDIDEYNKIFEITKSKLEYKKLK